MGRAVRGVERPQQHRLERTIAVEGAGVGAHRLARALTEPLRPFSLEVHKALVTIQYSQTIRDAIDNGLLLFLDYLLVGNIRTRANKANKSALRSYARRAFMKHPAVLAVVVEKAVLHGKGRFFPKGSRVRCRQSLTVFRGKALLPTIA